MTRPAVVVGDAPAPARRPSLLPALIALAAVAAAVAALQGGAVRTADAPPAGLRIVETRTWQPTASQWTLSRVYGAPDGRALAFTARRGAGGSSPAVVRAGGPGEASLVRWGHLGFGYTIVAVGIAEPDLVAVVDGITYDRTGLGTTAVPRPGGLPAGLLLLSQRSGPSAGPGTGPTGTVTRLAGPGGAAVTVTASDDAVVTAAHLSSLLRLTPRGSEQLVLDFPGDLRWLVADRGATTLVAEGTGVSAAELASSLEAAGY